MQGKGIQGFPASSEKNLPMQEKDMSTHFSISAWKIPWTEGPGSIVHGVAKSQDTT